MKMGLQADLWTVFQVCVEMAIITQFRRIFLTKTISKTRPKFPPIFAMILLQNLTEIPSVEIPTPNICL